MYLCQNGVIKRLEMLHKSEETTFTFPSVKKADSGNYSCVYSEVKYTPNTATAVGNNSIFIQVKDFMMAQIFVETLNVSEGENMDVICTISKARTQKTLYMYLCKNGTGVDMTVAQAEGTKFTLKQVGGEDSGNYSCVYSIKKHLPGNVTLTSSENSIIIQVTVSPDSKQEKSSQNTPSLTLKWIILVTIPVILLCVLGAVPCFYRSRLLSKRQIEETQVPGVIYSDPRLAQSNSEPEPSNSAAQQTDEVFSRPTDTKAKKTPKSHSSESEQTDEDFSRPTHTKAKKKRKSRSSESQQTDEVYCNLTHMSESEPTDEDFSRPRHTKAKKKRKTHSSESQQTDEVYCNLSHMGVTEETQQTDVVYSESTRSRSKRKPKSSSPAEMEYANVRYKEKKKRRELPPPEDSVLGEHVVTGGHA
ncbi:uncharacterized protein LOC134069090 [Sardina pilchardus]|uniref:uncharacterized protein LOC134069090 n=1 Tax=Sardina pilchardus TaxID=27697 RepID=UPI002E137FC7